MRISEVNVTPIKPTDGLVAFASCVIDERLFIGSLGVHKRLDGKGYRITYPTKRIGSHNLNYYYPITKDAGMQIERAVVSRCAELFERRDEAYGRYDKNTNASD